MYYQLHDSETTEILGSVEAINFKEIDEGQVCDEVSESWEEFNKLEEHHSDPKNVDDFIEWHNDVYVSQLVRFFLTPIQH